jgi:hypothetical protein
MLLDERLTRHYTMQTRGPRTAILLSYNAFRSDAVSSGSSHASSALSSPLLLVTFLRRRLNA